MLLGGGTLSEPPFPAGLGLPAAGASRERSVLVGPCEELLSAQGSSVLRSCVRFHSRGTFSLCCLRDVGVSSWDYFCFPVAGDSDYSRSPSGN